MRPWLACALLLAAPAAGQDAPPAHADFWSAIAPADRRVPCTEGTVEHRAAVARLSAFDRELGELRERDAVAPARRQLHLLLQSPCFRFGFESARIPWPDSVPALQDWFARGGGSWLSSYLELPRLGVVPDLHPHVVLPPDPRPTLQPGSVGHPHALDRWLCPASDAACGASTRGWVARAEHAIRQHTQAARADDSWLFADDRTRQRPADVSAACVEQARDDGGGYAAFRACLEDARPVQALVPIAGFRVPDRGWLLVSGRRGHYEFCDEVAAYDLATGQALVDASCSALALEPDGTVDRDRTNMRRRHDVRSGRVSVEHLREVAWMLLFRSQFVEGQEGSASFPLPAELRREWATERGPSGFTTTLYGAGFSTAQTSLTWMLVPPEGDAIAGDLTWPSSPQGAEDHAVQLLTVAERGLVRGCRGGRPPAALPDRHVVVDEFVDGDDIDRLQRDLTSAHQAWMALAPCR